MKLKGTRFLHCQLQEADFALSDLTNARFDHCDLSGTVFDNTNLEGADFRTASNFTIDPVGNLVRGARFDAQNLAGLLAQFQLKIE
jgi:uncharacterized protein YjbI with pentapeptide repeats